MKIGGRMKKLLSLLLILVLCLSGASFATESKKQESKHFEWVANEKQLELMNQIKDKGYSDAEILKIIDPVAYKKLERMNPRLLKALDTPEVSAETLMTRGFDQNPNYGCDYRIQHATFSDQIRLSAFTETAGGKTQDLGLWLTLNEAGSTNTVDFRISEKLDTDSIYLNFISIPEDGSYWVHCRHAFGYIDNYGNPAQIAPTSHTDEFSFTKY